MCLIILDVLIVVPSSSSHMLRIFRLPLGALPQSYLQPGPVLPPPPGCGRSLPPTLSQPSDPFQSNPPAYAYPKSVVPTGMGHRIPRRSSLSASALGGSLLCHTIYASSMRRPHPRNFIFSTTRPLSVFSFPFELHLSHIVASSVPLICSLADVCARDFPP